MSKSTFTSYVKSPHLSAVIEDQSTSCEEKISKIKGLIDGKKLSLLRSGEAINTNVGNNDAAAAATATANATTGNEYDLILNGLSGAKERQLGEIILQSINQSNYMSYDRNSFEIIVASETIKFTNIKHLISFCVTNNAANLPIGLTLFLEGLLHIKTDVSAIRSGDSIGIKDDLLKIRAAREKDKVEISPSPVNGGEAAVGSGAAVDESLTDAAAAVDESTVGQRVVEDTGKGRKRRREVEEEETLAPAEKKFGLDDNALSSLRRSPRLSKRLDDAWNSGLVDSTSGKKKKSRK